MSNFIRETFAERIRRSAVLSRVLKDMAEVSGLKVHFYGCTERSEFCPPCYELSPVCRRLNQGERGRQLCEASRRRVLEDASKETVEHTCAGGTVVCAAPLASSAGLLGHLVAAGFFRSTPGLNDINRTRHLLERNGIFISPPELMDLAARTPVLETNRLEALRRVLEMASGYLIKELSLELFQRGGDLPESIQRACLLIQERFQDDPPQEEIARAVGLSTSHFSRLFHRRTGLRYTEYMNEVRLQYARRELRERNAPVTQVAMDAGYRSISQFNRQFKSHYGVSPLRYRKGYR
ncbi:MAG: helix-turn-helix domain-containing protein [Opitutales bacterium]